MAKRFSGFPPDAFGFYADLELDNSKEFWTQNRPRYEAAVAGPMGDLLADLAGEFGEGRMFRPYRDVRFSADKSPYKDHQGAYVEVGPSCGYYVQVSSGGLMVGAGWYASSTELVARWRAAIDEGVHVPALRAELTRLERAGMEVGGEVVRTRPRGVPADHPDLDLMRHRTLIVSASSGYDEPWLGTATAGTRVRNAWRRTRPLVQWLADNVTGHSPD